MCPLAGSGDRGPALFSSMPVHPGPDLACGTGANLMSQPVPQICFCEDRAQVLETVFL